MAQSYTGTYFNASVSGTTLTVIPLAETSSAVTLTVKEANGGKTTTVSVTVEASGPETTTETTPWIPEDAVCTKTRLSEGITIKDKNNNEWTWVVVPKSITASATTDTALIQADKYPYTYVTCDQANTLAMQLATNAGGNGSLLFGTQWDLTLAYLVNSGALTSASQATSDSTDWGNYRNKALTINSKLGCTNPSNSSPTWSTVTSKNDSQTMILTTGAVESVTKKLNIVDLAGNACE